MGFANAGIVSTRGVPVSDILGAVSLANSSAAPLGIGGVFTGAAELITNFAMIYCNVFADEASATDGLSIQQSSDGVNWDHTDEFTIPANTGKNFSINPVAKWLRIVYTNGAVAQTEFRLQLVLKSVYGKPSSHRISDTISGEDDAELVKSILTGLGEDGTFENVDVFHGALNVHQSDLHRVAVNRHFTASTAVASTVSTAAVAGDTALIIADTTGFSVGDNVVVSEGSTGEVNGAEVTAVAAGAPGTLTLDRPLDNGYGVGAGVDKVVANMAATVGTLGAPISYRITPLAGQIFHIWRLLLTSVFSSAAADNLFGNQTALTNGVVLRQNLSTGTRFISDWKSNSDMKRDMYDVDYSDRAGPSLFGMSGRFTLKKLDFTPELNGDNGDFLEILVQDDITSLASFEVHAQGHLVGV